NNHIPGVPRLRLRTGDPTRCLKSRLPSKKGRFRETLLGKRNDQSGRNVINGDANLHIGQLSIPVSYARTLYRKVRVTETHFDFYVSLLSNGSDIYPGCQAIIRGNTRYHTRFIVNNTFKLQVGDYILRDLIDHDLVLFNRQPSLHRCSIMLHRSKV